MHDGRSSARTHVLGVEIYHEELGAGPPLVLLHGLDDSHRTWRRVVPRLARSHRVLTPDLPGCGLSGRPDASYALDWQARVVVAWMEALGIEAADVIGHSYGGGVAQQMLLVRPQRIRRLVLVASGGLGPEVALRLRLASLPRLLELGGQPLLVPLARALRRLRLLSSHDNQDWQDEVSARPGTSRALGRTVRDVISWRGQTRHFVDRAIEIERFPPVQLFWCTRDPVIPYAQALATLSTLRGARAVTFEGCGHAPHQDRPEQFVDALLAFVDAPSAPPVRFVVPTRDVPASLWAAAGSALVTTWRRVLRSSQAEQGVRLSG